MKFVNRYSFAVLLLLLLLVSGLSFAQEEKSEKKKSSADQSRETIYLETIVVKVRAVKDEEKQEIDSRKLRLHNLVDFSEILSDELVEVSMIRKSGYGNEVSVRGFGKENFKVLLDGGILEGACGSRKDPHLSHINMLTVDKLTMQQGPFDVTKQGSLGGYVDVTTKKPEEGYQGEVLLKTGVFGFNSGGITTSGGNDKIQGLFGINFSNFDQYKDGAGVPIWKARNGMPASYNLKGRQAKSFEKIDIWGKLQLTPAKNQKFLFEHTFGKAEDILTPRVPVDIDEEVSNMSKASWEMRDLGEFSKKLSISFYRNKIEHNPFQDFRNVAAPKNNKLVSVISGATIQNITNTEFALFTYGFDLYHRDWKGEVYNSLSGKVINDKLIPSVQSSNLGGFLQMDKQHGKWSLGLGIRFDHFQQEADEKLVFSSRFTDENRQTDNLLGGHISSRYVMTKEITLFGGIGRSYRTPTSLERYIQGNSRYFGNPELNPTSNTEIDLGLRFKRDRWMFQAKGFYSDLNNFIYQQIKLSGIKGFTNIDAHIWGGDIKADIKLNNAFSLNGGVAYQRGKKDSFPENNSEKNLGQIPPLKSRLALNFQESNPLGQEDSEIFATMEWVHSAAAKDIDMDAGEKALSAWNILNVRVGYQFNDYIFNIGIDNLFDQEYAVANSYEWAGVDGTASQPVIINEPGRFIYASLGYNW